MNKPALLVVDDDAQVLAAVRRDLRGRYRDTYTVMSAAGGEEALTTIRELKARGDALAIVISDQRMPGLQGTDVLAQSREVYPLARRVLLTAYSDIDAAIKAINVSHLDHYLAKLDRITIVHLELGAVHDRIALAFTALIVNHRDRTLAIHDDQIA